MIKIFLGEKSSLKVQEIYPHILRRRFSFFTIQQKNPHYILIGDSPLEQRVANAGEQLHVRKNMSAISLLDYVTQKSDIYSIVGTESWMKNLIQSIKMKRGVTDEQDVIIIFYKD